MKIKTLTTISILTFSSLISINTLKAEAVPKNTITSFSLSVAPYATKSERDAVLTNSKQCELLATTKSIQKITNDLDGDCLDRYNKGNFHLKRDKDQTLKSYDKMNAGIKVFLLTNYDFTKPLEREDGQSDYDYNENNKAFNNYKALTKFVLNKQKEYSKQVVSTKFSGTTLKGVEDTEALKSYISKLQDLQKIQGNEVAKIKLSEIFKGNTELLNKLGKNADQTLSFLSLLVFDNEQARMSGWKAGNIKWIRDIIPYSVLSSISTKYNQSLKETDVFEKEVRQLVYSPNKWINLATKIEHSESSGGGSVSNADLPTDLAHKGKIRLPLQNSNRMFGGPSHDVGLFSGAAPGKYYDASSTGGTGCGSPVLAADDGTVLTVIPAGGSWGNALSLGLSNKVSFWYAHMCKILVKPGDKVKQGDVIGIEGSTGNSSGTHTHFSMSLFNDDIKGNSTNSCEYLQLRKIASCVELFPGLKDHENLSGAMPEFIEPKGAGGK